MIRLRFSTTKSIVPSAFIRWRTQCAQSHVELINDDGFTLGARWSLHKSDNGVRVRPPSSTAGQINVVHATYPGIEKAWEIGLSYVGTPYNLRGILGIALAKDLTNPGEVDCSHYQLMLSYLVGWPLLSDRVMADWKITPRDLIAFGAITLL